MRYIIENEEIRIEVESLGAELKSMQDKRTKVDYMWCADPKYYQRTSPNLFPIVGGLRNKKYRYAGREYEMGQHGFVRDMEWSVETKSDCELSFFVEADEIFSLPSLQKYEWQPLFCPHPR